MHIYVYKSLHTYLIKYIPYVYRLYKITADRKCHLVQSTQISKTFERNICNHKTSAITIMVEWELLRFICLTSKSCDRIISVQFKFFTLLAFYV